MKSVFIIYGENDETRPNIFGVASSKENADKLIVELEKHFDGSFEYWTHEIVVDVLNPDGLILFE